MPKYKDRVVILCVVFNYRKFIGLKLYNIDKNSFIDVFKNELYLYDYYGKKLFFCWMNTIRLCRKHMFMDFGKNLWHLPEVCLMQLLRRIHIWKEAL